MRKSADSTPSPALQRAIPDGRADAGNATSGKHTAGIRVPEDPISPDTGDHTESNLKDSSAPKASADNQSRAVQTGTEHETDHIPDRDARLSDGLGGNPQQDLHPRHHRFFILP